MSCFWFLLFYFLRNTSFNAIRLYAAYNVEGGSKFLEFKINTLRLFQMDTHICLTAWSIFNQSNNTFFCGAPLFPAKAEKQKVHNETHPPQRDITYIILSKEGPLQNEQTEQDSLLMVTSISFHIQIMEAS